MKQISHKTTSYYVVTPANEHESAVVVNSFAEAEIEAKEFLEDYISVSIEHVTQTFIYRKG